MPMFHKAHNIFIHDSTFNDIHGDLNYRAGENSPDIPHDLQVSHGLEILRRAASVEASYDSVERYPPPQCHPGTRTAVISTILAWIRDPSKDRAVLWLNGPAGAGKSAIAQTLAEECANNGQLAASFFFSRRKPSRSYAKHFFPSISYQLSISIPQLKPYIGSVMQANPSVLDKTLDIQFAELIVKAYDRFYNLPRTQLKDAKDDLASVKEELAEAKAKFAKAKVEGDSHKMREAVEEVQKAAAKEQKAAAKEQKAAARLREFQPLPPLLVIVDGLDECTEAKAQQDILFLISRAIINHKLPLYFLIASRPEPHIREVFNHLHFVHITRNIVLDNSFDPDEDIRLVLESGFNRIHDKHQNSMHSISKPWPSSDVIRHLVDKSSGQFIYADTVLKFVDDKWCHPSQQLDIVLGISSSKSSAFTALDELYTQILSTNPNTTHILHILGTLLTLHDSPLAPQFIEQLLFLQSGDVTRILSGMHSLLNIPDDPSMPIQFFHASLSDFLASRIRSGIFFVDTVKYHSLLAIICLKLMTKWSTQGVHPRSSIQAVQYALHNWSFHFTQTRSPMIFDALRNFQISAVIKRAVQSEVSHEFLREKHKMIEWLAEIPEIELANRYSAAVDFFYCQILSHNPHPDLRRVVAAIIAVRCPLRYNQLCSLLNLKEKDVVEALAPLNAIFTLGHPPQEATNTSSIEVRYTSLTDFLTNHARSRYFFIDLPACHAALTRDCLKVIRKDSIHECAYYYAEALWPYHLSQSPPNEHSLRCLRQLSPPTMTVTERAIVRQWLRFVRQPHADLIYRWRLDDEVVISAAKYDPKWICIIP